MAARPSNHSEQEPLLAAHSRRPHHQGSVTSSSYNRSTSDKEQQSLASSAPTFSENTSSSKSSLKSRNPCFPFSLSLRIQVLIAIMVAIPTYLLASTAVTQLGPLSPRNAVVRSPQPDPVPQSTSSSTVLSDPSNPFASILGPHISSNFPDPAVIYVDGVSYAFATNNRQPAPDRINIQVATSTDNQTWTLVDGHDALPGLGSWETGAGVWAPDVVQLVSKVERLPMSMTNHSARTMAHSFSITPTT